MRAADYEAKAAEAAEGAFLYLLCQPLGGQLFALDAEGEYRFAGLDAGEDPLALLRESGGYLSGIRLLGQAGGGQLRYFEAAECAEPLFVFGAGHAEVILLELAYADDIYIHHNNITPSLSDEIPHNLLW